MPDQMHTKELTEIILDPPKGPKPKSMVLAYLPGQLK